MTTKLLIVGYGSIGQRHYNNFNKKGLEVKVLSRRVLEGIDTYGDMKLALDQFKPDIVFISLETKKHFECLKDLNDYYYNGKILCEKPIAADYFPKDSLFNISNQIYVTYNLRFHPFIRKLKAELKNQKILTFTGYVGQYLPDWRPHADYRENYSAKKSEGGGVLRELSHEIDYSHFLFGSPKKLRATVKKVSQLEISTEDFVMMDWELPNGGYGHLTMNYLDRKISRFLIVNTENHTYRIDFINGEYWKDKDKEVFSSERNVTYENMVENVIKEQWSEFASFEEAMLTMKIIKLCEESEIDGAWKSPFKEFELH